MNHWS